MGAINTKQVSRALRKWINARGYETIAAFIRTADLENTKVYQYATGRNHKLDEWHTLCDWAEGLPEYRAICLGAEGKENV